jgi:hypothetical protein
MQIRFNALCTLADLIIETGQLSCSPYSSRAQASVNPGYMSKGQISRRNLNMPGQWAVVFLLTQIPGIWGSGNCTV